MLTPLLPFEGANAPLKNKGGVNPPTCPPKPPAIPGLSKGEWRRRKLFEAGKETASGERSCKLPLINELPQIAKDGSKSTRSLSPISQIGISTLEPLLALSIGLFISIALLNLESQSLSALSAASQKHSELLQLVELTPSDFTSHACREIARPSSLSLTACAKQNESDGQSEIIIMLNN